MTSVVMNIKSSGSCFILKKKLGANFPLDEYRHSFINFFKVSPFYTRIKPSPSSLYKQAPYTCAKRVPF